LQGKPVGLLNDDKFDDSSIGLRILQLLHCIVSSF